MKTGVAVLILLLALSGPALATEPVPVSAFGPGGIQGLPPGEGPLAQRGCCSWHKGVCGCQNGRVVCCDGTLSSTCTCRADGGAGAEFPAQAISDRRRAQSAGQRE
ncbi:hypothetical protein [Desulfocurvus vexinensis]|uniref:hypothetical protein n=1 Tax=Desulfocurvus vexinensis TaxID=399548 RepID=UPI0004BBD5D8|nr:hypothetical protein [Desulfocurvus vexinensis]